MALDVALARTLPEGEGILRIYRWSRPTLSFGRNQPAKGRYDPFAAEAMGVDVVRRPTGGREILHDRELTYSVVAPVVAFGGLRPAYHAVNEGILAGLSSIGVRASLAGGARSLPPDAGPCFDVPAEGEIVARGRKLVGSAQARFGRVLLQHGSLLLAPPSFELAALGVEESEGRGRADRPGRRPERAEPDPSITLAEILSAEPGFPTVAAAVEAGLAGTLGGVWSRGTADPRALEVAATLLPHYESLTWTWRR